MRQLIECTDPIGNSWVQNFAKIVLGYFASRNHFRDFIADKVFSFSLQPVWPDVAKIPPLWENFKTLRQFLRVYLVFGKILNPLWKIFYTILQIFIVLKGQTSNK